MATRGLFFWRIPMKTSIFTITLQFLIAASAFASQAEDALVAEPTAPVAIESIVASDTEIGEVYGYSSVVANVSLTSNNRTLDLARVVPRFAEDKVVAFTPGKLRKGAQVSVRISVEVGAASGRFAHYFDVYGEGSPEPVGSFAVRGFADWIVDPKSTKVELGNIDLKRGVDRTFGISLRPGARLKLTKVISRDPRFDATVGADGNSLRLQSRGDAPLGVFDTSVIVSTDHPDQKRVGFVVRGQILGRVVPDSNPVDFGVLRIGDESERLVRLTQVDGEPIRIGRLRKDGTAFDAELKDCIPVNASCKLLRLHVPPQMTRGQVGGTVFVDLPDYGRELPIRFGIIVIGKETKILDLNDEMKAAADVQPPVASILQSSVKGPTPAREMPDPPGAGPLLKWQATHEFGVYGYEVFRATNENGPFVRMNKQIVPVLDESGEVGSNYRWRDTTATTGADYWYYIGIVNTNGGKSALSTPQKVRAH